MSKMSLKAKVLTGLLCAIASTLAMNTDALARNLYVSPSGDGSTGQSWKKAWQSPQDIVWEKVQDGDQIILDGGGTDGITYTGGLVIAKSNVVIRQARRKGRNGQVRLQGPPNYQQGVIANGVTITGNNVHVIGNKRSGIKISRFAERLVLLQGNNCSLKNIEMGGVSGYQPYGQGRVACLDYSGYNNRIRKCDFRDFTRNAVETAVDGKRNLTVFRNCTFGSIYYGWWGEFGVGITGADNSNSNNATYVIKCVMGPYNLRGIDFKEGKLVVSKTLFLGSQLSNLRFEPAAGSSSKARIHRSTFFESNLSGPARYFYELNQIDYNGNGKMRVSNSIVYGGVVDVPAGTSINGGGNIQHRVSGNTQALANQTIDPQYVEDAAMSTPVTASTIRPRVWTTTSYALAPNSPATGKGSPIINVTDIVPAYGPNSGFPPLGGP